MRAAPLLRPLLAALAPFALLGCHPTQAFESTVQITAVTHVATAENGEVSLVDVEVEWDPCPGDQFQMIRGGNAFAACVAKYPKGTYVPVEVVRFYDAVNGRYRWDIQKLGDCPREIEPESEGSYEKSQECAPVEAYGHPIGFECSRRPFRNLVATCPWMER